MRLSSRYDGKCKACWQPYSVGEAIEWDPNTRKAYHPSCAPPETTRTQASQPRQRARAQAYSPAKSRDRAKDAALAALVALEEAILQRTDQMTSAELEKSWERYQKAKALALAPGTDGEGRAALRAAIIEAVKLAF